MQELLVDFITSLDGYASAEGWPGYWGLEGPEYLAWLEESPESNYTALMGATTYRLLSGLAAASDDDTFAQLTAMSKVVFSSTLKEPLEWANARLVQEDPVEAVRSLKAESPHGLRTIGSLTLCRSLLEAGLVDRFRLSSFRSSPAAPGGSASTTGIPTSASRWSPAAHSTAGSSCSSTCPKSSPARRATIARRPELRREYSAG